jgi:hypothetical protein
MYRSDDATFDFIGYLTRKVVLDFPQKIKIQLQKRKKKMEHSTFVQKYRDNKIEVSVDKNKAGFMYKNSDLLPQNLRKKQALIRTGGVGGVLLGIVLFFFSPWWLALIVLFLGLLMFPNAQKSAAKGVLDASLANQYVYQAAVDNQVIVIREKF